MSASFLPAGWREAATTDGVTYYTDTDELGGHGDGPGLYVSPAVPGAPAGSIDATTYIEVGEERLTLEQARSLGIRLNEALSVAVRAERAARAAATPAADRHVCPRRDEAPPGWTGQFPGHDWWEDRAGARCCSWCGSRNPDDLMALLRTGSVELGPTDKAYKAYIHTLEGEHAGKFYFQHLSDEQRREFVALLNAKAFPVGYPGHFYVLPFFAVVDR